MLNIYIMQLNAYIHTHSHKCMDVCTCLPVHIHTHATVMHTHDEYIHTDAQTYRDKLTIQSMTYL